jgi:hypothetical protein
MGSLAETYNARHGSIISPRADVDVPMGWLPDVDKMLARLAILPTEIRAFLIIVGICRDDETGLLEVAIGAATECMPVGGMNVVDGIVQDARNIMAWTCETEGNEGWLVHRKTGPTILCPTCQKSAGIEVRCYGA